MITSVFKRSTDKTTREKARQDSIDFLLTRNIVTPDTTIHTISRVYNKSNQTTYVSFMVLRPVNMGDHTKGYHPFYLTAYISDILQVTQYEKRGYICIKSNYSEVQDKVQALSFALFQDDHVLKTAWL